ncbi:DUF4236 domain-containing protein [Streptomyces silvisoli]|uniref:DUF4236 domain-containing protein n=1 Tax=Streptomyces silvisoli TaxID=3034235 RepID=A0ABT5ZPH7_9ACTN|nr:DUF4236 domain-containing protein [Streptomyces silvisoli]MDF3291561.1 DUF4236 domain-containing protein [Streptomyces silvisoli]
MSRQKGEVVGFSYRKSFRAGPFRVTASKSGLSYSAGIKGVRVTKWANGPVQTTFSTPETGMRYTSGSGKRQKISAMTNTAMADRSAGLRERKKEKHPGAWYFAIVVLSAGLFTAIPFAHAAARLQRRDVRLRAGIYAVAAATLGVLTSVTPQDRQGHAVGSVSHALSLIVGAGAIALMAVGCFQLTTLRREVYGLGAVRPVHPAAADPVVAGRLAARARRSEARSLAQSDPVLAQDLHIGRPDLPGEYDDGGLIDLNSAPVDAIAAACSIELRVAARIVAVRQNLGSFNSLDEVFAFAEVEEGAAARIREYALLPPR